ncbi:hypothetical protein PPL_01431 [Heterostelium album PN500]|uniref:Nuclear envelope membrane protein n=1 Tax=Heterostelium pallidum (strain ATCC 26659 / Pp 5 / PN500) TaxID=670386 RepID=D3AZ91_HETP5|nr:hypothetical protein PPL_01431 [Heterostelium album PN500]EFA85474.1 hypothetical protein PPL_01431 [Heterostelium album PN500]|eukprot:XP_020437582.1 hypothetical protein PPL_01431 [Heterostelium album PN500]
MVMKMFIQKIFIFIKKCIVLTAGIACLLITLSSVIHLIDFLSWFSERTVNINNNNTSIAVNNNNDNNKETTTTTSNSNNTTNVDNNIDLDKQLINNIVLIVLFMLQHSLMATDMVKQLFQSSSRAINSLQRSFYLLATSIMIEVIIKFWQPLDSLVVWTIDDLKPYCLTIKFIATIIILLEFISIFDIFEFTGLKQIYNYITDKEDVEQQQQQQQQYKDNNNKEGKILKKMRHPTLIGFMLLMWSSHRMTIDLLALYSYLYYKE